jgi:hypothetical protein
MVSRTSYYDYRLVPSLLRRGDGLHREKFLFQEYKRAAIWFQDKRQTDWETLFDIQHYWIPTRLLDWTEVLGIAIAFAIIKQRQSEKDAAIFIIDSKALNELSGLDGIKHVPDESGFEYQSIYWHNKPLPRDILLQFKRHIITGEY